MRRALGAKSSPVAILLLPVVLALLAIRPASAFKPNDAGHLGITSEALVTTQRVVDGETLKFSDRAIKQIRDANKATDSLGNQANASFHFDDEAFAAATARLVSLKASVISKITASSPNGESARKDLGSAMHTLQDFYAHSNWVELGNAGIDTRLGRSTYGAAGPGVATCPSDPGVLGGAGLTTLTTGYFKIPLCVPPPGKCRHGIPVACPTGLNKDDASRPNHAAARSLAVDATKDFLNQILDDPGVAGNAKAIKALMDIKGTLGMIIDDTGSMGGTIDQVKAQVAAIVNSVAGTEDEPDEYLLVRFGDPDVGGALVTNDAAGFLANVNSLSASGGGDCPELSMSALLTGVAASRSDSTLFLFTDASAKDGGLAGNVAAAAQEKRIKISPILSGSCSPIDPAYPRIAAETGGQLFFLDPSEIGKVFDLVKPQLTGDFVSLLSAKVAVANETRELPVPVDSTITNLTFSISDAAAGGSDLDTFSFAGLADDRIVAEINAARSGSALDSVLTLYGTDGSTVLVQNDQLFGSDSGIQFELPQSGTYYLQVSDWYGSAGGPDYFYSLSLHKLPVPAGAGTEVEPNNDAPSATPIGYGTAISGTVNVVDGVSSTDLDTYSFAGQAGDKIAVEVNAARTGSALDSVLTLYDTDGSTILIQNDELFGSDSGIQFELSQSGTYFLRVEDYYGGAGGPDHYYSLILDKLPAPVDIGTEAEPNNDASSATPLGYGNAISGTIGSAGPPAEVTLLRPSGAAVAPGDAGVTFTDLSSGRIITIAAPETGEWRVQVAGTGEVSVAAKGNSPIDFASFEFVKLGGDHHEGFFAISGQPVAGADGTGLADLIGPYATANFELVSPAGETIVPVNLSPGNPDAAADEFVGDFALPTGPFRVVANGTDGSGLPYRRLFPTLFQAQSVEVAVSNLAGTFAPGATTTVEFTVLNLGASGTFEIVVTDSRGFVTQVTPTSLALDNGASGAVQVAVAVPPDAAEGSALSIVATAKSTLDATINNSATLDSYVGAAAPAGSEKVYLPAVMK